MEEEVVHDSAAWRRGPGVIMKAAERTVGVEVGHM
jgi:hypothetical protein